MNITAHGLDAVRRKLHGMQGRTQNLSPAWEEFIEWWADTNAEQFASRGRRWRTPWRPLAPSTRASKRRQGLLSDPLVATTALRDSLTRRPLGIERMEAGGVTAGTREHPARFHQSGTRRMPARPLVNADRVAAEGAAGALVLSWIMDGDPNIGGSKRLER